MSSNRKRRRRQERQRTKQPSRTRHLGPTTRIALIVLGTIMVLAGAALLGHGTVGTEARLSRLAGILILIGLVLAAVGFIGKM